MKALCIRRSVNTNAFGLRDVWIIFREPNAQGVHEVYSFGVNYLDADHFQVGADVDVPTWPDGSPKGFELVDHRGEIKPTDVPKFLGLFNDTLAAAWSAPAQKTVL